MAKIDEVKEYLTTLRVFFTVMIAVMVAVSSGVINSYRNEVYDVMFWIGCFSEIILMISVIIVVRKIKTKTNEIKEL